jgi:hypothetical protein
VEVSQVKGRRLLFAAVLLAGLAAPAARAHAEGLGGMLDAGLAGGLLLQTGSGEDTFRVDYPERTYLLPRPPKVELFSEFFRVGVSSGLLLPLLAAEALYNFGWWTRLTFHKEIDLLKMDLFRSMGEFSVEIGQSTSSPDDQSWRITSNLYFFKFRALADFMPERTSDLYLFGGVGMGIERGRGHKVSVTGFKRVKEVNYSPLLEGGAGISFPVSRTFMLDLRVAITWPVFSTNIILYLNIELGVFFNFL